MIGLLQENNFGLQDHTNKGKIMNLSLSERADNYAREFPNYPSVIYQKGWLYGIWMIGNNFRSKKKYYGEYPPSYLKRLKALFPDCKKVLHLFSGVVEKGTWLEEVTFDINSNLNPDVVGDAHNLSEYFDPGTFDLVVADPPYSQEDAFHYGTPMVNRNKVVREVVKVLKPRGFLCWLDQVLPMYRKRELVLVGTIGIVRSTNHRFRVLSIFQKSN